MKNQTPTVYLPGAIAVTIIDPGDNEYLAVPVTGRMQIIEVFADGSVMGVFQPGFYNGCTFNANGGLVKILRPKFTHS